MAVNCRTCEYFLITWQSSMPYGCKAHGFKSKQLPSLVVAKSSGIECLMFKPKIKKPPGDSGGNGQKKT